MSEVLTRQIDALRLLMGSPRDPHGRVFAQLGDALRRAGSHREALDVLQDGVAEHPNFTPGHLVLGWTAQEMGDLQTARAAYERTVELDPENPNGLFGLGRLLQRDGSADGASLIEEAESLYERVGEIAPGFPGPRVVEDSMSSDAETESTIGGAGTGSTDDLPYIPLAELAPDAAPEGGRPADGDLSDLPFVALDELAPDPAGEARTGEAAEASDDLEALPFVALDDLRPDVPEAPEAIPEPPEEAPEARGEAAAEAPEEAPEAEEDDEDETLEALAGPLATRTMGELLVRQGLTAEAVEVFETLVARSPEDEGLRERLAEVRASLSPGTADPPADAPGGVGPGGEVDAEPVEVDASESGASPGAFDPTDGVEADGDEVAAHPSMDPPVPHPEVPSPFHLGASEADDAADEEGEVIGDYFARLLAWSPHRGPSEGVSGEGSEEGEEPASS